MPKIMLAQPPRPSGMLRYFLESKTRYVQIEHTIDWSSDDTQIKQSVCKNEECSGSCSKIMHLLNVFPDPGEGGHTHGHLTFSFFSCQ